LTFQLLQPVERYPAALLELRDHRRRRLIVLFWTHAFRLLRGEPLPTRAAAKPLSYNDLLFDDQADLP
jgi:hypothetical protein